LRRTRKFTNPPMRKERNRTRLTPKIAKCKLGVSEAGARSCASGGVLLKKGGMSSFV
jgi:hypothetical protein